SHASYSEAHCSAFIHDVCDDGLAYPFPDGILDVILLVFVLSSIHPDRTIKAEMTIPEFISELCYV
ncbi:methyltransferase-like protein 8-like isoform 2, partial [Cricetulus griseus]